MQIIMTDQEKITDLESKLADALAKIAELESLLSKSHQKKTSKNSHIPPSVDLSRKNQSLREKSDKAVGGQLGHEGSTLLRSETPDVVVDLRPSYCNSCGKSLVDGDFELLVRRQVIDLPPIIPIVTDYVCYGTKCSCGQHMKGTFPAGVDSPLQYGPNVQAMAIYQNTYQFMPFKRLQDFFKNVCNLPISPGTIENIIRRNAEKARPIYEHLRTLLEDSFYVGADETGFKSGGAKHWFWVWQNAVITYIVAASTRAKTVITDTFPTGLLNSILVSDRLAAQLSTPTKGFQLCIVHLLRDLTYLIEAEKTQWAIDFKALLKDAIKLKQAKNQYLENDKELLEIKQRTQELLKLTTLENKLNDPEKHKQTIVFFSQIVKLKNGLFTFLQHKDIPFDNNASERAIRNVKVKMKVSGQFKSLQQEFAILRSVIDTATKNGQSVIGAINAIVNTT